MIPFHYAPARDCHSEPKAKNPARTRDPPIRARSFVARQAPQDDATVSFRLFMRGVLFAPLAVFLEFNPILQHFLILRRKIIHPMTFRALEFDEVVL